MRKVLIIALSFSVQMPISLAQNQSVETDYRDYYLWFHQYSQTELLYQDNTTLYIFGNGVNARKAPCLEAEVVTRLNIGQAVQNIAYPENYLPEDEIQGYGDIWYHVKGLDHQGKNFEGYIWGAWIAKAWKHIDIDNDKKAEFIMLGVSSKPRKNQRDINAEIRMIKDGKIGFKQTIPGLCVFEDCATSTLIRSVKTPAKPGIPIIETSTMTLGCDAGIEKSLMVWNGLEFDIIFHSEMLTKTTFLNESFIYTSTAESQNNAIQLCRFSHEDQNYNPVWVCKPVPIETAPQKAGTKPKA